MIICLSPAKRLDESEIELNSKQIKTTRPIFAQQSEQILKQLKKMSELDLMEMMKVSANIAQLNCDRFNQFESAREKIALFLFQGDSYRSLNAQSLKLNELNFAQDHLRILSGFYGLIRPLDLIKAYRLEMGTNLSFKLNNYDNLVDFWYDTVNQNIKDLLKSNQWLINLASNEYFAVVDAKQFKKQIIHIIFKQKRNGQYRTFGILAKKARGLMARYLIENQITDPEKIKSFNLDGYSFAKKLSSSSHYFFIQE